MSPSRTATLVSPTSRPPVSVVTVAALTGMTALAKPAASEVTANRWRERSSRGTRLIWSAVKACMPVLLLLLQRQGRAGVTDGDGSGTAGAHGGPAARTGAGLAPQAGRRLRPVVAAAGTKLAHLDLAEGAALLER